jgi:uncharacterized protein YcbK (DUF882 family)
MRAISLALIVLAAAAAPTYAKPKGGGGGGGSFSGHNASKDSLRKTPLDKPSGHIVVHAENLGEDLDVNIYKADGTFDDAALAKLDNMWRCQATGEVRAVNAELYEQLSRIYDHFGKTILFDSGFRFTDADSSRHFHASAMDIKVKDTSYRDVYAFAQTLDVGGKHAMGIGQYPTTQFVHIDFRAPGDVSFRWTDTSGHSSGKKKAAPKKATGRTTQAKKPVS